MKTKTPNMSDRSAWLRDNTTKYFSFSAIIILLVAPLLTQDDFLGTGNLKNLLRDTTPLVVMFAGITMALLFGSIDLSMGVICSVSNMTYIHPKLASQDGFSSPPLTSLAAMAVSLVFGLASGLTLGIIHVKLKVPSFIASLDFMSLRQSVALLITQNPELMPKTLWGTAEWYKITFGVVDLSLIVTIATILSIHCATRYIPSGRTILAIGDNERIARVAGTGVGRIKTLVPAINGVLAALTGAFLAANLRSSVSTIDGPFILRTMAAYTLGSTSLTSDRDSGLGVILGVFTMAITKNGMNLISANAYYQNIALGIFVLAAIAPMVDRNIRDQIVK